jgi:small subunit ribosomal protein S3
MGQKVHPGGMRVGVIHDWKSNWYTGKKEFPEYLIEDIKIREHINGKLAHAGLSDILIRKDKQRITVDIYTARPGIVIGKSGVEVDALRKELHALTKKNVHININEIKRPELDAKLVAQSIAEQLQNRVSFRRAMKRALASGIRSGAKGIRIQCGGRLGGTEMSRSEAYSEGRVPLHTIRADIDYGFVEAKLPFGRIGVKVWINKGEIMPEGYGGLDTEKDVRLGEQDQARRRRGGAAEGLGASRESGRDRQRDRSDLGPVRPQRRRGGQGGRGGPGGRGGRPAPRDRAAQQDNVERPRTDETAKSAEGREQPAVEPQVETSPAAVSDAPDTTTPKQQTEDATKREKSTDAAKASKPKPSKPKAPAKPKAETKPKAEAKPAAQRPVRAKRGSGEGARGNREVPPTGTEEPKSSKKDGE